LTGYHSDPVTFKMHLEGYMATLLAYVNPPVAVALGWGLAGEPMTATTGVAAAAIAASVAMVLKGAH
jgi:drug/metabolite transporter (DMT)-like permease